MRKLLKSKQKKNERFSWKKAMKYCIKNRRWMCYYAGDQSKINNKTWNLFFFVLSNWNLWNVNFKLFCWYKFDLKFNYLQTFSILLGASFNMRKEILYWRGKLKASVGEREREKERATSSVLSRTQNVRKLRIIYTEQRPVTLPSRRSDNKTIWILIPWPWGKFSVFQFCSHGDHSQLKLQDKGSGGFSVNWKTLYLIQIFRFWRFFLDDEFEFINSTSGRFLLKAFPQKSSQCNWTNYRKSFGELLKITIVKFTTVNNVLNVIQKDFFQISNIQPNWFELSNHSQQVWLKNQVTVFRLFNIKHSIEFTRNNKSRITWSLSFFYCKKRL